MRYLGFNFFLFLNLVLFVELVIMAVSINQLNERNIMYKLIPIILTLTLITACGNNPNKTAWSLGTGAILGGSTFLATKNPQATILATGVGLAVGDHIGSKFDEVNRLRTEVLNINRDGEVSKWKKVEDGEEVEVAIAPVQTKKINNRECREYDYAYTKSGVTSHGKGVACMNADGEWQELYHHEG